MIHLLCVWKKKLYDVKRKLGSESLILFEWFRDNYLKANRGKSHAILTTDNKLKINVKGSPISNEKIVNLLHVTDLLISFLLSLILIWYVKKLVNYPCPC